METTAVHALEQDQVPASTIAQEMPIPAWLAMSNRRRHDLLRALMREALALGDIHSKSPNLKWTHGVCASVPQSSSHFHSDCSDAGVFLFSGNGSRRQGLISMASPANPFGT